MKEKVLIVEDEKELAKILAAYLEVEGFEVCTAQDGESGWEAFVSEGPGLALLDIMLPKQNGIELCRKIREISDIPVIMVSAKSGEMDKVIALGSGADDYVTKPFSPLELVARVKANLRRYHQAAPEAPDGQRKLKKGLLSMNYGSYTASVKDVKLVLTTKEFEVLFFLAEHPEQVFSKEQIYQNVWGYEPMGDDNSVTVYINRLREKLNAHQTDYIKTVWGAGYKFVDGTGNE